ncbi:Phosphoacetylglucosamine mutase [Mycena venus]|uniref:phosphoacetylglucosamine mutase n=1 Tax=Mycena venus TaxID=2733690 RepID=A0A8H6XX48_9AGAR|nr:Phosphoacetylglucosamine mutase [Mycena venus]
MALPVDSIKALSDLHPKPSNVRFQYGTAGFRTVANVLDSVLFRVGVLAGLRSKKLDGKTIGVMVTASHNPEQDNGVKLVDPRGEMLDTSWEIHATALSNAQTTDEFISELEKFVQSFKIDLSKPARVVYARDTRPSGEALVASLEDGIKAIGAEGRNAGVTTTPVLHYLVRAINTKGTKESYGEDSEEGYFLKLANAFKKLVSTRETPSPLLIDCANGVGAPIAARLAEYLGGSLPLVLENASITTPGALNNSCGADYVKTSQKLPPSLAGRLQPGQRGCSLDGDADRLMYFYLDERGQFHMLDGDKIAALVAAFIVELVKTSGLDNQIKLGVVQTAYANGGSTKYLSERLPVKCVSTGVKHLHHAAEHYNIGIYFEANGHGTVLFSQATQDILQSYEPSTPAQSTALEHLRNLNQLINQTVGDALSDMLLVEVVLAHKAYSGTEWDSLYVDLPNRLVKVVVADRNQFKTEDAERRLVSPAGLQDKITELVRRYEGGRSFVRPSGTEDVVRVYAEASIRAQADELAFRVAGLVYDECGGNPATRPKEFIIINQAFDSRLRLDRRRPMNGDGFGVGWYDSVFDEELGPQPCIFTSVTPAWNNINLTRLAEKIKSPLVFGHVRATTAGSLSLDNCHPFVHGKLMFMHNGGIAQWEHIKRMLQKDLPDVAFNMVQGNTDSEWAFALFISKLPDPNARTFTPDILRRAMLETIASLNDFAEAAGVTEPSLMNFCVTDGDTVIATRYISSDKDEAASLWFSSGTTFSEDAEGGHYRMSKADKRENIIMIASEPLTFERADWMEIKTNTLVVITPRFNLLQIPIVDKFSAPGTVRVPMHSFLLLVCFNIFAGPVNPWLLTAADAWGQILAFSGPLFILLEGVSSLLVVQKAGQIAKELVAEGESYQLGLLVGTAVAYVSAFWWIVVSYSAAASSPLASTLLGAALCTFFFLSCIGFVLRRTNVVESSGMLLFIAYNVWLCGLGSDEKSVFDSALSYAPLLPNIMPHFEALFNFILLFALLYRLTILQLASRILPTIGADSFDDTYGVDDTWEDRPTSALTRLLLTYRQSIFVTVYSHLLLLDPSSQVWSRWMLIFFTLLIWAVELLVSSAEDDVGKRLD